MVDRDGVRDHQPAVPVGPPARLADLLCGHWAIEALHDIRDVTLGEDAFQVRTGTVPHVMAVLRNLVIGVLSRAGQRRCRAAQPRPQPTPTLATPGISLGWNSTSRQNDGALAFVQVAADRRSLIVCFMWAGCIYGRQHRMPR